MSKAARRNQSYRKNASKLHTSVGDLLRTTTLFKNYRIYQEYPVNMISPYFDSGREKFDWVIMDIMVIIECMGEQHFKPVRFGGMTQEEAESKYQRQIYLDNIKQEAALTAGWTYITFRYDEEITLEGLLQRISAGANPKQISLPEINKGVRSKNKPIVDQEYTISRNKKAKEYRKQQYQRQKEWRKNHGN